jgi:pimeloyl-ACP methyl ester carboxylesterase
VVALAAAIGVSVWRAPMRTAEIAGRLALRAAGFEAARAEARRGPVHYFRGGSGPLLVLVHGANDQAGTWARVAPAFTATHRVVIPDLAGHGDSAPADGPLLMADLVDGLEAVLRAEGGGRVVLAGNSLGGFLSLVHADRHPADVAKVVAINGAIMRGGNEEAARLLLPQTRNDARRVMEALVSPRSPRVPDFVLDDLVSRAPRSPLSRLTSSPQSTIEEWLLDDRLAGIRTPVALIWGADDRLIPVRYAEQAQRRLPNATLEVIPACGHVPQRECPAALLPHLQAAIRAN